MMRRARLALPALLLAVACPSLTRTATADLAVLVVDDNPTQNIQASLDLVDASSTQSLSVTGWMVAEVTLEDDGNNGQYVSAFQAIAGRLWLASGQPVSFELQPPTSACYGSGGPTDFCDTASGYCTETVGSVPGHSVVTADMGGLAFEPGGGSIAAVLSGPNTSVFPLFDVENPEPAANFKLNAFSGTFDAEGCALNQIVAESHDFGCNGCEADFFGFPGQATVVVNGTNPVDLDLTLPLDHSLLVIGWSGPDQSYGIMNLSGDVHLVPEPGQLVLLIAGLATLSQLVAHRKRGSLTASR